MARPQKSWPPTPMKPDPRGQVRVWWRGRSYTLGSSADPAGWKAEYQRLILLWQADPDAVPLDADDDLVAALCRDYLASDAVAASRRGLAGQAADLLLERHGGTPVADFGPVALREWQSWLCRLEGDTGRRRFNVTTVRMMVGIVRRLWKWGVSTERVGVERYHALLTVEGPRKGEARPAKVVRPADPDHVKAALPHLLPPPRAIVELQLLTGARPSELCGVRPRDVLRGGVADVPGAGRVDLDAAGVWVIVPADAEGDPSHKTAHHGKSRWLVLGPRAQAVLAPFLEREPGAYCFSPAEADAAKRKAVAAAVKGPRWPHLERRYAAERKGRAFAPHYTEGTLYTAVRRACQKAGVPHWAPYSLRHLRAAEIDTALGLDAAQATLGHSSADMTRRYSKRSFGTAADVARKLG